MDALTLFDQMWKDFDSLYCSQKPFIEVSYPPMNVWVEEETKNLILEFAVAGIPRENINIDVEGDYLILGIDKVSDEKEGFKIIQKGIKNSKVRDKIYIPSSKYNTVDMKAKIQDGILAINVPAKEEIKPKRVQIEYKK